MLTASLSPLSPSSPRATATGRIIVRTSSAAARARAAASLTRLAASSTLPAAKTGRGARTAHCDPTTSNKI
jgi:hypothetical protein